MKAAKHTFFIHTALEVGGQCTITGDDVKHMQRVLRLRPGDRVSLVGPGAIAYQAVLTSFGTDNARFKITGAQPATGEPSLSMILLQGIPKGDKLELVIQKGTELGMGWLVPVMAERSVVQLNAERADRRHTRWQRVAEEAAKQCGRGVVPVVGQPAPLVDALRQVPGGYPVLMAYEGEQTRGIRSVLRRLAEKPPPGIALLVGPEGGWTEGEVQAATSYGVLIVGLGPRILRTETAGLAMLVMVMYELGDLGGERIVGKKGGLLRPWLQG